MLFLLLGAIFVNVTHQFLPGDHELLVQVGQLLRKRFYHLPEWRKRSEIIAFHHNSYCISTDK